MGLGLLLTLATGAATADQAPGVTGQWLTENKKGVVDIHGCGADKLCGTFVWVLKHKGEEDKPAVDRHNPDEALRSRALCGLEMLGDFTAAEAARWEDGWIYNPENGKTYTANMTLQEDGTLKLRGYVGIPLFGESQVWTRADGTHGTCQAE